MTDGRGPRVALVCPFSLSRLSGTPVRSVSTAIALRRVAEVEVLATGGAPDLVTRIDAWQRRAQSRPRLRLDRLTAAALSHLRAFDPDIVHMVTTAAVPAGVLYKIRHPSKKLIFEVHGLMLYEMRGGRWVSRLLFRFLDRIGLFFADEIIAMSHSQAEHLADLTRRGPKGIHPLWGPVDVDEYPASEPPSNGPFTIGYLGGNSFWQGIDSLLEAANLLESRSDLRFLLAGFDPSTLRGAIPPNVELLGKPSPEEGIKFLSRCHVLVSARIGGVVSELQYPHKLSHYLAAGRPIVASNVSDQGRIIQAAECGFMFDAGDPNQLSDAIVRAATADRSELLDMGRRARQFAQTHLSLPVLGANLLRIYGFRDSPKNEEEKVAGLD